MLSTDLKVYKALANGRMDGASPVTSGVLQNVFPHVTSAQRTAGLRDAYKTFWKVADDSDGTLLDPELYHDAPTKSATEYVVSFVMDQRETIASISGLLTDPPTDGRKKYGTAYLKTSITAGDQTLVVTVKDAAMASGNDAIFASGDKIKLTDKATADALTGNEEILTINGAPSVSGTDITITVTELIANNYTAATTPTQASPRVSTLYQPADGACSVTTPVKTSTAGTVDFSTYPIILDNIGTVDEDWTITFTDATHFTLSGDSLGAAVATGVISADFAPSNSIFTKPFFTIELETWGGTWAPGDTVTFTTHPATFPRGQKRVVPPGTASLANNRCTDVLVGEAV
jgi:hypothetical protein